MTIFCGQFLELIFESQNPNSKNITNAAVKPILISSDSDAKRGFNFEVQRLMPWRIPDWVSGIQGAFWDGCSNGPLPYQSPVA